MSEIKYHREEIFGDDSIPESGYLWCLHCQRCYVYGQFRLVHEAYFDFQMCPYPDCNGSVVCDGIKWEELREHHPEYPEIPKYGVVYRMYPISS